MHIISGYRPALRVWYVSPSGGLVIKNSANTTYILVQHQKWSGSLITFFLLLVRSSICLQCLSRATVRARTAGSASARVQSRLDGLLNA